MKRYSHTAIVTVSTGSLVKGEWIGGKPSYIEIKGQYYPSRDNGGLVKMNIDGDECPVHGEFSTKAHPVHDAKHIRIESIGLDADIICWEPFQTHSVIYV